MTGTFTFNAIQLYGFHGVHPEEVKVGSCFYLDVKAVLKINLNEEKPTLINSIDYEQVYSVIKLVFDKREALIETVALNIYNALKDKFPQVEHWAISIKKQNPLGLSNFNPKFLIED